MGLGNGLTIAKLRIHGAKVVSEVGLMVEDVKTGDNEALTLKIKNVRSTFKKKIVRLQKIIHTVVE